MCHHCTVADMIPILSATFDPPIWLSVPKTPSIGFANPGESEHDCWMFAIAFLFVRVLCDCFKSRRRLESKILVLRHQLNVLQLRTPRRLYLTWIDRALFVWLYRGFPRILDAMHFGCTTQRLPAARVSCRSRSQMRCCGHHPKEMPPLFDAQSILLSDFR